MKAIKNISSLILILLSSSFSAFQVMAAEQSVAKDARMLTNLLEYIGRDYPRAVEDGKVISELEYNEMKEFQSRSRSLFLELNKTSLGARIGKEDSLFIARQLDSLQKGIEAKKSQAIVASITKKLKKQVLALNAFEMVPKRWPSIDEGKQIYQRKCAACHGKKGKGNGPAAAPLKPKPTNFVSDSINAVSPFQYFNVTRLGIEGTGMRAFNELSNEEVWDVAFYLNTLPYQDEFDDKEIRPIVENAKLDFSLKRLATNSDHDLIENFEGSKVEKLKKIAAIRLELPQEQTTRRNPTATAIKYLDQTLKLYENNEIKAAKNKAIAAYLEGIEPIERGVKATSPQMVAELESDMEKVRNALKSGNSVQEVRSKIERAKSSIHEAKKMLAEESFTFWSASIISGSILLREGLEAFLIIITILSVLRAAGASNAAHWVHGGWIVAIGLGIASWFFTDWLIAMGGTNREILEGVAALIAVVILLYVGFWFHNKTESKKWKQFVEKKIGNLVNEKNLFGLAALSFIVVFREAFESVLFLSTLNLKVEPSNQGGIWFGALIAAVIVGVIAVLLLRYSKKIPIPKLFKYSAIVISVLAVILAGNGIHEFQEAGFISITQFPIDIRVSLLGIYPTYEIIAAQVLTIALSVFLWLYSQIN